MPVLTEEMLQSARRNNRRYVEAYRGMCAELDAIYSAWKRADDILRDGYEKAPSVSDDTKAGQTFFDRHALRPHFERE